MLNGFKSLVGKKKSKEETQIETYKSTLEKDPNNVNARLKLGDLYAKMGDKQNAIKEYTTAAVRYADDGFLVKAIAVNKIIVRLEPSKQEALDRLSDLYFQRGVVADPLVQSYRESRQQEGQEQEAAEAPVAEAPVAEAPVAEAPVAEAPAAEEAHVVEFSQEGQEELPVIEPEETESVVDAGMQIDLREEAEVSLDIESYLNEIPLLSNLSDETKEWLKEQTAVKHFAEGSMIFKGGEGQESLFLVLDGSVKMLTKDREGQDTLLDRFGSGAFFGDISLFVSDRQSYEETLERDITVIAENSCTSLEFSKSDLVTLVKKEPDVSEALSKEYSKRMTSDITLARVPLFSYLDPIERRKIAENLSPMNVRKGTTIITEGEMGDSMYVVKSGEVGVYTTLMEGDGISIIKTDQERLHLATLQDGDFFGEQALITKEPRSATIIAMTDVQLLKFSKQDLAIVVKQYPRVGTLLKKYHQQRISNTMESLKSIW